MFIWSFRMSKRELIIICAGAAALLITLLLIFLPSGSRQTSALAKEGYSLSADSADARTAFLGQFGWQCDPEPVAVKEIIIPAKFNDVYQNYNELQKEQGFDLQALSGRRVKLWTYQITNYPGGVNDVVANLLVLDGKVVGGDISSTVLDGFMHGFDPSRYTAETAQAQLSAGAVDRSVPDSIPTLTDTPPEPDDE